MKRGWAARDAVDREGAIRRHDLLRAAREAFEEFGFAETPISEISRRAGLSRASFYVYFASKQEALDALVDELNSAYAKAQTTARLDEDDVEGVLAATLRTVLDAAVKNYAFMQVLNNEALRNPELKRTWASMRNAAIERAAGYIRRAQERRLVDPVVPPEELARVGGALNDEYSRLVIAKEVSFDQAVETMMKVWLSLVRPVSETA